MLNFGCRGQEGLHALHKNSYTKFKNDKGMNYYEMTYNDKNKTQHGIDPRENDQEIRLYEKPCDVNCPLSSLDFYLSNLNPDHNCLIQQPRQFPIQTCWYAVQPMGKNKILGMMTKISLQAGLSRRYTNHCIKATVATGLKHAGIDVLSIMSVTGHRNVKSLDSYIEGPSDQQRRSLSATLQSFADAEISSYDNYIHPTCNVVSESESILPLPTTVRPVASSSSQEMHMIPGEHCQIANVNTTVSRNPLSDMNLCTCLYYWWYIHN
jgi:hypothetical protein